MSHAPIVTVRFRANRGTLKVLHRLKASAREQGDAAGLHLLDQVTKAFAKQTPRDTLRSLTENLAESAASLLFPEEKR